ncbi:Uma2 family endonuclease [Gordonia alkaliphila]|uniref:Uma2 family endonuclease n=1 Tax=Gordonia alkaliphila TaxID=1053547 RepID=UPI001FF43B2D|nr:Uma2 family endonuclease [Gordonia alkaliphila]MCK0439888.1 Uma2 family endonuclease [Gordonia alkaliphila]
MTVVTTQILGLPRGRALTRADLTNLPDDGHRYELIDGTLVVSPAPKLRHQRAVTRLAAILRAAVPDHLEVLVAPFDVVLADDTVLQPDVLVAPIDQFTERDLRGAPLVAVEVLSPSTRGVDLLLKKERLARAGCAHYWIVDPDEPSITAWTLVDGDYAPAGRALGDQDFAGAVPFGVRCTPRELTA